MIADITPEHAAALIQGVSPVQFVILVLLGGLFVIGIIGVVRWVVDTRMNGMPEDIKEIKSQIERNNLTQARMEEKLWKKSDILDAISSEISKHEAHCPGHSECSNNRP